MAQAGDVPSTGDGAIVPSDIARLQVDRVALASVLLHGEDGERRLSPLLGVWVDCTPLDRAALGVPVRVGSLVPVLSVVAVAVNPDTAALATLTVVPLLDSEGNAPERPTSLGRVWTVDVPVVWLGLAHTLADSAKQVRIALLNGPAPQDAEHSVVSPTMVRAVILTDDVLVPRLLAYSMPSAWHARHDTTASVADEGEVLVNFDVFRDSVWLTTAGLALGQHSAWNRAVMMDAPGQGRDRLTAALVRMHENARASSWFTVDGDCAVPAPMNELWKRVAAEVDPVTFAGIAKGYTVPALIELVGFASAAAGVMAAAALSAWKAAGADGSVAYRLAQWSDGEDITPWWSLRAVASVLIHHDADVLADLLSSGTDDLSGNGGDLLHRWVHTLSEALTQGALRGEGWIDALHGMDILLPNTDDLIDVALTVLGEGEESDGPGCGHCAAATTVVAEFGRFAGGLTTVAALLPVMADLYAAAQGTTVGDEEWRNARFKYLLHWLNQAATPPQGSQS